jgi:hypothetical protein
VSADDLPADQRIRRDGAPARRVVAVDLRAGRADERQLGRQLGRIDRARSRSRLRAPDDGAPDAVSDRYPFQDLPDGPRMVERRPTLRGKMLAYAGPAAGAHAVVLSKVDLCFAGAGGRRHQPGTQVGRAAERLGGVRCDGR